MLDSGEAAWLEGLARFDWEHGWATDGALSTVGWLVARAATARSSAYEKVQLARQLAGRRVLADALREVRINYSQLRVIARRVGADEATYAALVVLAGAGSLRDLQVAVGTYLSCRDQERLPGDRVEQRGLRLIPGGDGTTTVVVTLGDLEAAELVARCRRQAAKLTADPADLADPAQGDTAGMSDSAAGDSGDTGRNG